MCLFRWSSWFQLSISFTGVTAPFYPNLYNFKLGIGNLQVGINPAASLRSRDGGSPTAITTYGSPRTHVHA